MTTRIEELWSLLRQGPVAAQRRADASHPLDLYADYERPDRPGLVLFCDERPNDASPLRAVSVERRQRQDGRWTLRIFLEEPRLLAVFAELCRDIVDFTRTNAREGTPSGLVLSRIERWRILLLPDTQRMRPSELRGLIGELIVLEQLVLPAWGPDDAISAWTGPLGTNQDFRLPDGTKLEVKALDRNGDRVRINGLHQLDAGGDSLHLMAVRLEDTGLSAPGAVTASALVDRLRGALADAPAAAQSFETLLGFVGWDDAADTDGVSLRLVRIDRHVVDDAFPRLTAAGVPLGVIDTIYSVVLPPIKASA